MSFDNQSAAQRLAMCNDIGEAAYVDSLIGAALVDTLRGLPTGDSIMGRLTERYGIDPQVGHLSRGCAALCTRSSGARCGSWRPADAPAAQGMTGETFVAELGASLFHGDPERAGQRLLKDYRTGALGLIALEQPPRLAASQPASDALDSRGADAQHLQPAM